jgi:hypothetical protein
VTDTFYACSIFSNHPFKKALPVHNSRHGVLCLPRTSAPKACLLVSNASERSETETTSAGVGCLALFLVSLSACWLRIPSVAQFPGVRAGNCRIHDALGASFKPSLSVVNALGLSMTSFHGRGFFPGVTQLNDPLTILASLEAFVGLILEATFIATLTQRFFGK